MNLSPRDSLILRIAIAPVLVVVIYVVLLGRHRVSALRELTLSSSGVVRSPDDLQRHSSTLELELNTLEREVQRMRSPVDYGLDDSRERLVTHPNASQASGAMNSLPNAAACTRLMQLFLGEQLRCESSGFVAGHGKDEQGKEAYDAFQIRFVGNYTSMLSALKEFENSGIPTVPQCFTMRRDLHADECDWCLTVSMEGSDPR